LLLFFSLLSPCLEIADDQILLLQCNHILILGFPANQKHFFFCFLLLWLYYFNSLCLNSYLFIKDIWLKIFTSVLKGNFSSDINSNSNIIMVQKYS